MNSISELAPIEKAVMDLAVDDLFGLHEVLCLFNDLSGGDDALRISRARSTVEQLVETGWLVVFSRWPELDSPVDEAPVDQRKTNGLASLHDDSNWLPPNVKRPMIGVVAARKALDAYNVSAVRYPPPD